MSRWGLLAIAYGVIGIIAIAVGRWCGLESVWTHPEPWLRLGDPWTCGVFSLVLGLSLGGLVVLATRSAVTHIERIARLHVDLRPLALSMSGLEIVAVAVMSALGEELLFRGLLQSWVGLPIQALAFGLLHQIAGKSRWVWVSWATAMGLGFGAMFQLTGSLVGPVAAHALINGVNLAFLKHHDPQPKPRVLGGLLTTRGWVAKPH